MSECRARHDEFVCPRRNFRVADCVDDYDFDGLCVGGQFKRVVRNVNKFPVENAEPFRAVSRHVMQQLVEQNFLRRGVGDCAKRLVEALIELKQIVAELCGDELQDIFVGDARTRT